MKAFLCACWLFLLMGCSPSVEQQHLSGPTMGTRFNIKYVTNELAPDAEQVQSEIGAILQQVNDQMSTYLPESELSRFNRFQSNTPFGISPDTATVLAEAIRLHSLTLGKLDVTVGPLVNLWGFGPNGRPNKIPSEQALQQGKQRVGIQHLKLDGLFVTKDMANLYVDLSTLAKGFAADKVAKYLEDNHIDNYMVEIGGEIKVKGHRLDNTKWRIALEKPIAEQRLVQHVISPGEMAIATSGDYRNYFEQEGRRYSHIIDPDTGKPIDNRVVSVTVIHPSCMTADGLATGLMVLGDKKGMQVAEQNQIAVLMIVKTDEGFKELVSERFHPYLKQQE
ncbi:FAD:protein FMN transferase [Vibrio sp. NFV-1]|uniref:FAD:protein FMN transferase n=2 Tax=Vibrio nitrifigilis TaxID=2789781 RepID=A0ABS0GAB6_9VIBR|nr:FAD:protein FMN transferase [Vibrio nitrifigilis]MBF8999353.1 FAD:protein FMN transferase [Vibrio nitrifigilis]